MLLFRTKPLLVMVKDHRHCEIESKSQGRHQSIKLPIISSPINLIPAENVVEPKRPSNFPRDFN